VLIGPVFRSGKPVGLLTLDALQHGELAAADLPLLHLIAELLGIALSL
jgi:GAF domain-containing protein